MKGKALVRDDLGNIVSSFSTMEVYRYWKLAPYSVVLCVRRLRLFFAFVRDHRNHMHYYEAFFRSHPLGRYPHENPKEAPPEDP